MRLVFEGPDIGTELTRIVSGSTAPSTVEVRFEPATATDQLIGEPTAWCNVPSGGQPLIFNVPVPTNPGDPDTTGTLKVRRSGSSDTLRVPVTIKHEI